MPKNIVVLSDGTGQVGGKGHDTHVYKLFRMLEDRTDRQVVFYDEGLGANERRLTGKAFGRGFSKNILQCYKFIFDNYKSEDKLFFFGFSRGAATVRSLASFIHYFGILPMSRPALIEQAYKLYANRKQPKRSDAEAGEMEDRRTFSEKLADRAFKIIDKAAYKVNQVLREDLDEKSAEFVHEHPNQWVSIEFLGVWDTVPALGLVPMAGLNFLIDRLPAWKHQYHDFKLPASVRNAYHALSIDDDRKWFFPTVWKEYDPDKQKVDQVWFGGAHTDVGGGFWEAGFSDLALEWMVQKALQHGIWLHLKSRRYWNFCVAPDATDVIHPPRLGRGRIYRAGVRDAVWDGQAYKVFGPPRIHESVLERARREPGYRPWILRNYPEVDDWFKQKYEEQLHEKYSQEMSNEYEAWFLKMHSEGAKVLPGIVAWLAEPQNSYEVWLSKNKFSFEDWLKQNDYSFEEFEGKKILVERAQSNLQSTLDLRDYDRSSLPTKLAQVYEDRFAFDSLLDRAVNRKLKRDRMKYDADRWKLADSGHLEKSQQ
ncbi:MAG: DUF2235 domain-containing protein [Anaerolineae bacterium]|nr:DUF2235 domain-containing protein [Anaerolineae bacterium]